MKVSEHIITAPESNHFDNVGFNDGADQQYGAFQAKGLSRHVLGSESNVGATEGDRIFQCL